MKFKFLAIIALSISCTSSITAHAEWEWEITSYNENVTSFSIDRDSNRITPIFKYQIPGNADWKDANKSGNTYYYDGNTLVLDESYITMSPAVAVLAASYSAENESALPKEFLSEHHYSTASPHIMHTTDGDKICYECYAGYSDGHTDFLNDRLEPYDFESIVSWNNAPINGRSLSKVGLLNALVDTDNMRYIIPYTNNPQLYKHGDVYFSEPGDNYAAVYDDGNEKYHTQLIDRDGNIILTAYGRASIIGRESEGLRVADGFGKWYFDKWGYNIFPDVYSDIYRIDRDTYVVGNPDVMQLLKHVTTAVNTDVKTKINGVDIPCYSVNSRAVITAEDLRGYGFDVVWDGASRRLDITRNPDYHEITPVPIRQNSESGSFYDNISETDIKVYFNGKEIKSFAINGVMLIKPEDIEYDGITFKYSDEERTLYMTIDGLNTY